MQFNWLLLAGFLLRTADKYLNKDIAFDWYSAEGRKNLKVTAFNGLLSGLVYYLSFFIYPAAELELWQYMLAYFASGWFVDSFFSKLLDWTSKAYDKMMSV
jgi:hypothetical protein